jgi:two-component system, cell cycle sensor histidine kinase and response regulator CckA
MDVSWLVMDRGRRPRASMPAGRLLLLVLGPLVVATGLFLVMVPPRMNALVDSSAERRTLGVVSVLADLVAPALEFDDREDAARSLALLANQRDAEAGVLLDARGAPFAHWPAGLPPMTGGVALTADLSAVGRALIARMPVAAPGGTRGTLVVRFSAASVAKQKRTNWLIALVVSAILLSTGGLFAILAASVLARRDRAERALEEEAAKFRTLVEGMPDALVIHRGGRLLYANPAAQALLDLPLLATGGTGPLRARDVLLRGAGDALRQLDLQQAGKVLHLELHVFSLGLDGGPATIALARDVSERRRLTERLALSDRLASIGTLAAGVAHEINNPLTYILSNLDFVEGELDTVSRDDGDAEVPAAMLGGLRDAIGDAKVGATRVQRIVQDMKKLARGEASERTLLDVRRPLEAAAKMVRTQLARKAELVLDLQAVPPVMAGESQLMQVFINLLTNAADAIAPDAPPERRQIVVRTRTTDGGMVEIAVRDSGGGIPLEVRDKIFDAFFTTKPVGVGTGLGLSISHTIITSMGGSLTCDTAPGDGTTMIVQLPVARPAARARGTSKNGDPGGRILVVDDDQAVADAAARLLGRELVAIETSPVKALARLRAGDRFDLILCDVRMPDMTGPELRAELVRSVPEQAASLVFMTGASEASEQAELEALGVPILEKPFDRRHLSEFVASQMARLEGVA